MNESTRRRLVALVLGCATAIGAPTARSAEAPPAPALEPVSVRATAHFRFDEAAVLPADRNKLLAEVATMRDVTWQSVTATGHTDSVGPVAYNRRLAARRAQAVKAFLVGQGLDAAMIDTAARAADMPADSNDDADGRARNRRTEVVFQGVRTARP